MDLIFYSYKNRLRLGIWKIFLVMSVLFIVTHSWRITQKCPHGHYYNDGCTACWCDTRTGVTRCEQLLKCAHRLIADQVKCPSGRNYKDNCGNDCTCYESTGAVFCNEKRKCLQELISGSTSIPIHANASTPITLPILNVNSFSRRDGVAATYIPKEEQLPQLPLVSSSTYPPLAIKTSSPVRRSTIFDHYSASSTSRPPVRIPARSEELIIEPAIIIRKKGSNQASVVRNPSSAASVTLSTSRRNKPPTIILNKNDHIISYPTEKHSTSSSLAPLNLYQKQLKTIMDIRRAYTQLLRSKVNFNFKIATGKPSIHNTMGSSVSNNNHPFNTVVSVHGKNSEVSGVSGNEMSLMDHPRRFDSNYENSTILINSTPSPIKLSPFFWRREQIKNALKQFSPVPPLRQLVSYVSTSTESYLSQFLNHLGNKNKQQHNIQILSSPETTTNPPLPPSHSLPTPFYPMNPYSTIDPLQDPYDQHASISPIHEVYQNHDFKMLTTTTPPPSINYPSYNSFPEQYSYNVPNHLDKRGGNRHQDHPTQFPFMNELMEEIARSDHHHLPMPPTATPRSSPRLTAVPTFQTPGPPYAEIDVVHPLSFLPPPEPEPATPTRRTFMMSAASSKQPSFPRQNYHPRPTVRVNLDKPIYLPNSPQFHMTQRPQPMKPQQQPFYPQQYPPHLHQQHQTFLPQQHQVFLPQPQQTRRNHIVQQSFLHTKHNFLPRMPAAPPRNHNQHPYPMHGYPNSQFFIPRPKHYRLVLKGRLKEAATRVDDAVPRFVSKIAHEFFKKPDIYVPKIRPGKPLTLEKVILNHKNILPKEVMFSQSPGDSPTKLRFTPQAHWTMREDLAKQGIMLNEPLNTAIRDYANGDPNVMEMDAPLKAVQTWEKHTGIMGMGAYSPGLEYDNLATIGATQESQRYHPILLPSPTPPHYTSSPSPTPDYQHQQELQHQLLLAQQLQRQQPFPTASTPSSSTTNYGFNIDPSDFNDFTQHSSVQYKNDDAYPHQLNFPGVKQVVVDKFMVHDPLDPSGGIQVFSTTTVEPPLDIPQNVDLGSILGNHHQQPSINRLGIPMLAATPTPPPAVLIRHHGAPSPSPPPSLTTPAPEGNYFVTLINTTPQSLTMTNGAHETSNTVHVNKGPIAVMTDKTTGSTSIVHDIQDFLTEQIDFGARPQFNLYDMLFHSRVGQFPGHRNITITSNHDNIREEHDNEGEDESEQEVQQHDQMATATNVWENEEDKSDVDTEKVASIFSTDYKHKYNRKPPEVIVIKVPLNHSDEPFPTVVEKRHGQEIEIIGGRLDAIKKHSISEIVTSREKSILVPSTDDSEEALGAEIIPSTSKRRRNRKGSKRKRKRKKKKGQRNKNKNSHATEREPDAEQWSGDNYQRGKASYDMDDQNNKYAEVSSDTGASVTFNKNQEAEQKFQSELDWKSQLMANICDLNPSSPLCLTYRSICLLMTSDD